MEKSRHREVRYQECEAGYELSWCRALEFSWCQVLWLFFRVNCQHGEYLVCGSSHRRSSINKQVDRKVGERQGLKQFYFHSKQTRSTALHCSSPSKKSLRTKKSHLSQLSQRHMIRGRNCSQSHTGNHIFLTHRWCQLTSRKVLCFSHSSCINQLLRQLKTAPVSHLGLLQEYWLWSFLRRNESVGNWYSDRMIIGLLLQHPALTLTCLEQACMQFACFLQDICGRLVPSYSLSLKVAMRDSKGPNSLWQWGSETLSEIQKQLLWEVGQGIGVIWRLFNGLASIQAQFLHTSVPSPHPK